MNKIEVIQFFIADSAVLFFHVRIISRTPWTNFRYKGYFCRLIGQRQRITYLFAFTPGLCIIQVNGGSYSIKKNVFLIDVIDNIDFGIRIQRLGHQHPGWPRYPDSRKQRTASYPSLANNMFPQSNSSREHYKLP